MADIYANTTSVIVCLGRTSKDSERAFDLFDIDTLKVSGLHRNRTAGPSLRPSYMSLTSDNWDALRVFLTKRHYWWRLRIVQEIVYAWHIWICCGGEPVTWDKLARTLNLLCRDTIQGISSPQQLIDSLPSKLIKMRKGREENMDFMTLLEMFGEQL